MLAAGRSRRMGQPKALLAAAGETFLERTIAALRDGGCGEVVAVVRRPVGPEARRIAAVAGGCGARVVTVAGEGEQIDSLRAGLRALAPAAAAAVVSPVDLPQLHAGVVRALLVAFRRTGAPVVLPAYRGRHGHPVLFAREVFAELLAGPLAEGARSVVRAHAADRVEVALDEPGVLLDVDTPADYRRVVEHGS